MQAENSRIFVRICPKDWEKNYSICFWHKGLCMALLCVIILDLKNMKSCLLLNCFNSKSLFCILCFLILGCVCVFIFSREAGQNKEFIHSSIGKSKFRNFYHASQTWIFLELVDLNSFKSIYLATLLKILTFKFEIPRYKLEFPT